MKIFNSIKNEVNRIYDISKSALNKIFKRNGNINSGKTGRTQKNWRPTSKPFNLEIKGKESLILARSKFLEFNSTQLNSMLKSLSRNVTRTGIKPQAKIKNSRKELNVSLNDLIEEHWGIWTRKEFCDVQGLRDFYRMQKLIYRRYFVDGGIFVKFINDRNSKYRLKLQLLELELLDINKNEVLENGNQIVSGVEINNFRKPVAFWLCEVPKSPLHSYSNQSNNSKRISTEEIMLIYDPFRVEQLHPLSCISPIITKLNDLLDIDENELTKEKLQTALSAIIIKNDAYAIGVDSNEETDSDGDIEEIWKSGGVAYLEPGEDIKTLESNKNTSGYQTFQKIQARDASKAVGLSAEQVTGDLSEVNYSSARTGSIEDEKFFKMEQQFMIDIFCQPVYEKFIDTLYLVGILNAVDFTKNPYKYYKALWLTPGNDWIDPLKQANAEVTLIKSGLKTRRQYYGERGLDFDEQMDNYKSEIELLKSSDLEFLISDKSDKSDKEVNNAEQKEDSGRDSEQE
jgi:lambda family phage portal protein